MRYDRDGDDHFDTASALMKSLRGSDPDAALHFVGAVFVIHVILDGVGQVLLGHPMPRVQVGVEVALLPLKARAVVTAIRRLLCSASEDVGMAYPQAASIVKSAVASRMAAWARGSWASGRPS